MGSSIDSVSAWLGLWARLTGAAGVTDLVTFATWGGAAMIVFALGKWGWARRRGGAQAGQIGWPIFVGMFLIAPNAIIPAVLWLVDLIVNTGIALLA